MSFVSYVSIIEQTYSAVARLDLRSRLINRRVQASQALLAHVETAHSLTTCSETTRAETSPALEAWWLAVSLDGDRTKAASPAHV